MTDHLTARFEPRWLLWAREMQAIAQTGLAFARDQYDRDRYQQLQSLAARVMAEHSNIPVMDIETMFAMQTGYATPKLGVRAAIFRDQKILLVREREDGDRWTLPGGWADVGLSPAENAAKEVREESEYTVKIVRLLAAWDKAKHRHPPSVFLIWKLVFLGELMQAGEVVGAETDAVEFFSLNDLPPLSLGQIVPEP